MRRAGMGVVGEEFHMRWLVVGEELYKEDCGGGVVVLFEEVGEDGQCMRRMVVGVGRRISS